MSLEGYCLSGKGWGCAAKALSGFRIVGVVGGSQGDRRTNIWVWS